MIEILKIADDVRSLVDSAGNQFSNICAWAGNSCLYSGVGRVLSRGGDERFYMVLWFFAVGRYRNKNQENCFKDLMLVSFALYVSNHCVGTGHVPTYIMASQIHYFWFNIDPMI